MERLRREVQSLTDKLASVNVGRKKGAKPKNVVPGTSGTVQSVPLRTRRRRNRGGGNVADGEVSMQREELIRSLTTIKAAGAVSAVIKDYIDLQPMNFAFMRSLSKAFERIQWLSCHIYWKPAVGTTAGGLVSYAIDWDSDANNVSRTDMSGYTPVLTHAVWQDSQKTPMVLPPSRLMSRKWYLFDHSGADNVDKQPGRLLVSAETTDPMLVGELWIRYHVKFSGTRPS